jgi:hypothetical protein
VGVIFLQAIMETILAFFNHFPLFAIMLRLKDPDRLPGKSILLLSLFSLLIIQQKVDYNLKDFSMKVSF